MKTGLRIPRISLLALLCLFSVAKNTISAQTTIWADDFSSGQTSGNLWSSSGSNCDGTGFFGTQGGAFVINDWEGNGCNDPIGAGPCPGPGCQGDAMNTVNIGPINISSVECVQVNYFLTGSGGGNGYEPFGTQGGDFLQFLVFVDGNPAGGFTFTGNSFIFPSGPRSVRNIKGNSLTIQIVGGNQSVDETFEISGIEVVDASIPLTTAPITACQGDNVNLNNFLSPPPPIVSGLWSGDGVVGNTWVTAGLSPGNYTLRFEPLPNVCASPINVTATVSSAGTANSGIVYSVCGQNNSAIFDLTNVDFQIGPGAVFWFRDPLKQSQILNPSTFTAMDGTPVFGAFQSGTCLSEVGEVVLRVTDPPVITAPSEVNNCGAFTLPALPAGISYRDFNTGDQINSSQEVFIFQGSGVCISTASFQVNIGIEPSLDPYSGTTEACDSLLLPNITGTSLSGAAAYFTESGGMGTRYEAGEYVKTLGLQDLYMYDDIGGCFDEEPLQVNIGQTAIISIRDTIVCDTFTFVPYSGTGTLVGYYSNPGGTGTEYQPGDGIRRPEGDYTFYVQAGSGNCISEASFNIRFRRSPDITTISSPDACDDFELPAISGNNLSGNEGYYTAPNRGGTPLPVGFALTNTTTVYMYDNIGVCFDEEPFTVLILDTPQLDSLPDTVACDTFVLPPIEGPDVSFNAAYFTEPLGGGDIYFPGDPITGSQTVYAYDARNRCETQFSFEVQIDTLPRFSDPVGDHYICDSFMLGSINGMPLLGDEIYSTGLLGQGDTILPGEVFRDSATIYLYSGVEGCATQDSLQLFIEKQPVLGPLGDVFNCDFFVLPAINGENLTSVAGYYSGAGGQGNRYMPGDTLFNSGQYFVFDSTGIGCFAEQAFLVTIAQTPILATYEDTLACSSFELPIISGQNIPVSALYSSESFGNGDQYEEGESLTQSQTIFVYADQLGCFDTVSFVLEVLPQTEFNTNFRDTSVCDSFVLPLILGQNLAGNEAYFSEPQGQGIAYPAGTVFNDSIQLYLFGGLAVCTDEDTLQVHILPTPQVDAIADQSGCDFYELPIALGDNLSGGAAYYDNLGTPFYSGDRILNTQTLILRDTNAFGCGTEVLFDIRVTPTPILNPVPDQVLCADFTLPTIGGQFLPPTTAYYLDSLGMGVSLPEGLVLDTGAVVWLIADSMGCKDQFSFVVDILTLQCEVVQQVQVPNGSDGIAQIEIKDGLGPYQLVVSGPLEDTLILDSIGTVILENLAPGNYQVQLMDQNNCIKDCSFEISAPPCALEVNMLTQQISCSGEEDGRIQLGIIMAQAPLSIEWNIPEFNGLDQLSNLKAGNYQVIVRDSFGCVDSSEVEIIDPLPLSLRGAELQPVSSKDAKDGIAQLVFSGGTAPYQLVWDGPLKDSFLVSNPDSIQVDSLLPGIYIFGVVDANNCKISVTLTITNPNCGMTLALNSKDQDCPNLANGQIIPLVNGGTQPYTFIWGDNSRDSIRNDLSAGIYQLTLRDAESCILNQSDTITLLHNLPSIQWTMDSILCEGTCNTLDLAMQGSGPFTLDYDIIIPPLNPSNNITTISTMDTSLVLCWDDFPIDQIGIRLNTVSDAFCQTSIDTLLNLKRLQTDTNYVQELICAGDTLLFNGTFYTASNPRDTIVLAGQGAGACDSIIVVGVDFREIPTDTLDPVLCLEDQVLVNGQIYDFFNQSGIETLAGASSTGCDSIVVIDLNFFDRDTTMIIEERCRVNQLVIGNFVFDETNPSGLARLPGVGQNGCDSLVEVQLSFIDGFSVDYQAEICPGDSIIVNGRVYNQNNQSGTETLVATGGCDSIVNVDLQFFPENRSFMIETRCPGDSLIVNGRVYNEMRLTGTEVFPGIGRNGCDSLVEVVLNYSIPAKSSFFDTICNTDTLSLHGEIFHFDKPTGSVVLSNAAINGCDSIIAVEVSFYPELRSSFIDTLCSGDSLLINGTFYHALKNTGTEVYPGIGQNGCDSLVDIQLVFREEVNAALLGSIQTCSTDSVDLQLHLQGDQFFDVTLSGEDGQSINLAGIQDGHTLRVAPANSTLYKVIDVQGQSSVCPGVILGEGALVEISDLMVEINSLQTFGPYQISCPLASDGVLQATVDGGFAPFSYEWNIGASQDIISGLGEGEYQVIVTDASGCIGYDTLSIQAPPPIEISLASLPSTCSDNPNGALDVLSITGGNGNYAYSLDEQNFIGANNFPFRRGNLNAGSYTLTIEDVNGCLATEGFSIGSEALSLDLGPDLSIQMGDSIQLNPVLNFVPTSFDWLSANPPANAIQLEPFVSPPLTTAYTLRAVDSSGCVVEDALLVFVEETKVVYTPTAFTPNEDGINDRFTIFGGSELIEIEELLIFDRWGNLVFQGNGLPPNNEQMGWDGQYRGNLMASGTYIYAARVRYANGNSEVVQGEVALLR